MKKALPHRENWFEPPLWSPRQIFYPEQVMPRASASIQARIRQRQE
jgi:hypothetical protein